MFETFGNPERGFIEYHCALFTSKLFEFFLTAFFDRQKSFETEPVTGQTYSRKQDDRVMNWLGGIAQSAHRMTNDIRLLQHHRELGREAECG